MNPKRAKRFKELKQQAIITLYELDKLTGGDVVHDRNVFHGKIKSRIRRLTEKGEQILVREHSTVWYTIEGLEQLLTEANIWIAKVKLRGR